MPNYQNGKIYKIVNDINESIYVGGTSLELSARMAGHREDAKTRTSPFYTAMRKIGVEHFKIILLKPFPCKSKAELNAEEYKTMKELKREGEILYNIMIDRHCPNLGKKNLNHSQANNTQTLQKHTQKSIEKAIYPESVDESQYVEIKFLD